MNKIILFFTLASSVIISNVSYGMEKKTQKWAAFTSNEWSWTMPNKTELQNILLSYGLDHFIQNYSHILEDLADKSFFFHWLGSAYGACFDRYKIYLITQVKQKKIDSPTASALLLLARDLGPLALASILDKQSPNTGAGAAFVEFMKQVYTMAEEMRKNKHV